MNTSLKEIVDVNSCKVFVQNGLIRTNLGEEIQKTWVDTI